MIYLITIVFTLADIFYTKVQLVNKLVGHFWRVVRVASFFAAFMCTKYFPFDLWDFILCVVINVVVFPVLINIIALHKKWNYVGTTSETDKIVGKKQWFIYAIMLVGAAIGKFVNNKNKKV